MLTRNATTIFSIKEDDPQGLKTPPGSHIRRMNPRDADISGFMRFHRMIRRGTSYGPLLPPGVIEDDGAERGLAFVFIGASLERQFEFVQHEWVNQGTVLSRASRRTGSHRGREQRKRIVHHPATADPPAVTGSAGFRGHPGGRVFLRARPARAALVGRSRHLTRRMSISRALARRKFADGWSRPRWVRSRTTRVFSMV